MFTNKRFAVDFKRNCQICVKKFSTWNPRKKKEREQYFEAFSADNWKELSLERKNEHSLMNCRGCFYRYSVYQSFFPVQSKQFQGCNKENPVILAQNIAANTSRKAGNVKCTQREYKDGAQKVYEQINPAFERVFNVPLEGNSMSVHPKKVENDTIPLQFVLNLYSIFIVLRHMKIQNLRLLPLIVF